MTKRIPNKRIFALCLCFCLCMFAATNINVAFCTAGAMDAIKNAVYQGAGHIYSLMRVVVIPLVVVAVAWAGLQFLFFGSRGTENGKKILMGCAAAVVVVVCAPIIGNLLGSWFANIGTGDLSGYNPLDP